MALTVFLKRFFDKVDRRKFHSNLKMLCISHKMHEVLIFCLEYFDKLSYILDESVNQRKLNFNFQKDILPELPAFSKYAMSGHTVSVDSFWHDLKWDHGIDRKKTRNYILNQDQFY